VMSGRYCRDGPRLRVKRVRNTPLRRDYVFARLGRAASQDRRGGWEGGRVSCPCLRAEVADVTLIERRDVSQCEVVRHKGVLLILETGDCGGQLSEVVVPGWASARRRGFASGAKTWCAAGAAVRRVVLAIPEREALGKRKKKKKKK